MDLPIFHGRHSSNTQIQMKRVYYWAVWHSMTPIWEQHLKRRGKKIWSRHEKEKRGDLLSSLSESLYSRQHHVVLPKQGQPTMLHCVRKNKSATRADNNAGLNRHVENSSSTNKTPNSLIAPEGHVAHEGTAVARETQNNTKFSCKRIGRICDPSYRLSLFAMYCSVFFGCSCAAEWLMLAYLHLCSWTSMVCYLHTHYNTFTWQLAMLRKSTQTSCIE